MSESHHYYFRLSFAASVYVDLPSHAMKMRIEPARNVSVVGVGGGIPFRDGEYIIPFGMRKLSISSAEPEAVELDVSFVCEG